MTSKYKEIVKTILKVALKSLIDGTDIYKEDLWTSRFAVSEKCMVSIFEELIDSGYIKGCKILPLTDGKKTVFDMNTMEITLSGVEHLTFMEEE